MSTTQSTKNWISSTLPARLGQNYTQHGPSDCKLFYGSTSQYVAFPAHVLVLREKTDLFRNYFTRIGCTYYIAEENAQAEQADTVSTEIVVELMLEHCSSEQYTLNDDLHDGTFSGKARSSFV